MPNWCGNSLTVTGPAEELARFKTTVRGRGPYGEDHEEQCLSFHTTVPQPKFEDNDEGWYHWRVSRWGTKWEASDPRLTEKEGALVYRFETAWCPPDAWLRATAPQFPELEFRLFYAEGGANFAGVMMAQDEETSVEDKGFLEAMIEEDGSYNASCTYCDEEVDIYRADDPCVCPDCREHVCTHCLHRDEDHVDGKCLFDATKFKPIGEDLDDAAGADGEGK